MRATIAGAPRLLLASFAGVVIRSSAPADAMYLATPWTHGYGLDLAAPTGTHTTP
jgi:hypothetical protein